MKLIRRHVPDSILEYCNIPFHWLWIYKDWELARRSIRFKELPTHQHIKSLLRWLKSDFLHLLFIHHFNLCIAAMAPRVILGQEYSSYELNGDSESLFRIAAIFHENSLVQAIILGKDCLIDWMNGDLHERTTVRLQDNFKPSGAPCLLSFDGELHLLLPTMNQAGKSRLEHWKAKNRTDSWSHFCSIDEHVTESKLAFGSFQGRMFCVYVRGPENALQWRVNNGYVSVLDPSFNHLVTLSVTNSSQS